MISFLSKFGLLVLVFFLLGSFSPPEDEADAWGFFGHRRINRLAVFTLPPEMMSFYKRHLEYVTEHAVDPDKRRYATKHEAVRHYIDIDHWGTYPFTDLPRDWASALASRSAVGWLDEAGDTTWLDPHPFSIDPERTRSFFQELIVPQYYEDVWEVDCAAVQELIGSELPACQSIVVVDHLSEYGVLPYFLPMIQRNLTNAFADGDLARVLRYSADIGHYIGDAHVPLHTTENYNGQLTNQDGIHAFWESRLPELYADKTYDFFVGPAEYVDDLNGYYWDIVLESHSYVDSLLAIEKELSQTFPSDQQYCYEERLQRTIRTQCEAYSRAYHERLDGQVEGRMRASVLAVGSAWFTAWVDAGKPDLQRLDNGGLSLVERKAQEELEEAFKKGEVKGRKHE